MGILRKFREWREDKDGTLIGPNIEAESVKTEEGNIKTQSGSIIYTREFNGGDADERLDNALSAVTSGDRVFLEEGFYETPRTGNDAIDTGATFIGVSKSNVEVATDWEFSADETTIKSLSITGSGSVTFTSDFDPEAQFIVLDASTAELTTQANRTLASHISGNGTLTFGSDTVSGEIGIVSGGVSVTDNGDNRVL